MTWLWQPLGSSAPVTPTVETNYNATFSAFTQSSLYDWDEASSSPTSYTSYLKTYYIVPEEAMTWMQSPYIYVFMDEAEQETIQDSAGEVLIDSDGTVIVVDEASLTMNTIWDWSDIIESEIILDSLGSTVIDSTGATVINQESSPKVSRDIEVYRFRDGYSNRVSKNKIKGRGKVLQLKFTSTEGIGFNLLGWGAWISKNKGF